MLDPILFVPQAHQDSEGIIGNLFPVVKLEDIINIKHLITFLFYRHNSNLPPSVPEGQEIPSGTNQVQGYTNFGKQHNYFDKMRQNSPNVASTLHPNTQSMIPNLQNLNPNMQSSPNLTHVGSNAQNLSLNFQNLSPITTSQCPMQSPGTPQLIDSEFHRLNTQMTTSGQYNGNAQVNNT